MGDLKGYLQRNIDYPDAATFDVFTNNTDEFTGNITIRFMIGVDGRTKDPVVLRGINEFADSSVIKVILGMPIWEPAIQNGVYVESIQEITFLYHIQPKRVYR